LGIKIDIYKIYINVQYICIENLDKFVNMKLKELTNKQKDILKYLLEYHAKFKMPPTVHEICSRFDFVSSNSVTQHFKALEKRGYIKKLAKGYSRNIKLLNKALELNENKSLKSDNVNSNTLVPINIAKAQIINDVDNKFEDKFVYFDSRLISDSSDIIAIIVLDKSMMSSGLSPNDICLVSPEWTINDGDCCVYKYENDFLIRNYKDLNDEFILMASEKGFPKMIFEKSDKKIEYVGKVIFILKSV